MEGLKIASKLPHVGTTIFTVMSALAQKTQAINLSQGFPDFEMPPELVRLTTEAMHQGANQYAPMAGWLPLRAQIAQKIAHLYGTDANPDTEITITPGGTYAIYTAFTTVLQPGDEVIVFEPAYDSYIPNIEVNGGVAVSVALRFPDYSIDWQEVRRKITPRTRMIALNTPHNPTGSVLRPADIAELQQVVAEHNLLIMSDEVYEHLIYDDLPHLSMLRYPDLRARAFVCFSFGKAAHCTGWKLGYCVAPPAFTAEFRKVHQFNCFSCFTPAQVALATYLKDENTYRSVPAFYQQKRDYFAQLMAQTRFEPLPSHGSYFQLYRFNHISNLSDRDFAVWLTQTHGVACIPASAFYRDATDHGVVRFCFAKKQETLDQAVAKLRAV
ncbi:MAG: aminotransferase class I/II-fold pyridoxal phosphate-dependent enzyme [Cytophagia bacterium]|nr:MAG: aminotransferase class I/II-fold pyridoxal phosphate-dependent enzyme [Cytophagales bacterium]TAG42840.1 MAG: aminotransferase class I/II-fold pyridoxal phosphate-dependent enzyme [Cytophagia bacterium]TAG48049.1 MAG: aminotransferase class I/II-fold pyridoxal phosphate-dependent enzyme [Runella slithyformis]TAG65897.1 MAG: aminotransferase class I/II-fold pyridoxal phosphate-dependent enzyme [Runella slithyformis]TAG76367.1 MAG: aminotransferase class I/II-fold pyridoxal phosphate-depe